MQQSLKRSLWFFVAYTISSLTMSATLVSYSLADAYYYQNGDDNSKKSFTIAFGLMSILSSIVSVWSIVALVEFIIKYSNESKSLTAYVAGTLVIQCMIWTIALVVQILMRPFAYYIFAMSWITVTVVVGLLSFKRGTQRSLPPLPVPTETDSNIQMSDLSGDSKEIPVQ